MRNLTAVRFEKAMISGRTRPLLLACEDADEESDGPTEYVVKLRGSIYENGLTNPSVPRILLPRLDRRPGRFGLGELDLRALRGPYQISGEQQCSPDFFWEILHGAAGADFHRLLELPAQLE